MDLPGEAGRTSAHATDAATAGPHTTTIADLAGTESKVVVIARHGMTIGSRAKARKRQTACVVA
jgi:hypothetical protein